MKIYMSDALGEYTMTKTHLMKNYLTEDGAVSIHHRVSL